MQRFHCLAKKRICLFLLAAAGSVGAHIPDESENPKPPEPVENCSSALLAPCFVGKGEVFSLDQGTDRTPSFLTVDGGNIKNAGGIFVYKEVNVDGEIVFKNGALYEAESEDDAQVVLQGDHLLLSASRIQVDARGQNSSNKIAVRALTVEGESRIELSSSAGISDVDNIKTGAWMNVRETLDVASGARLDVFVGEGTFFCFGTDASEVNTNKFLIDGSATKGMLLVSKPFVLEENMHFQIGAGEGFSNAPQIGPNLVLGKNGVLVLQRPESTASDSLGSDGNDGDGVLVEHSSSGPLFSVGDGSVIRFEEGAAVWISPDIDEDAILDDLNLQGADIEGLGNVEVRYDGQIGWIGSDASGQLSIHFAPMQFSGPFAGMLSALWAQRHDALLPSFFRQSFQDAIEGKAEASLLQASTLASRLGADQRLLHLHERAAQDAGLWFDDFSAAEEINTTTKSEEPSKGESTWMRLPGLSDTWLAGGMPLRITAAAGTSKDEIATASGALARSRIKSNDMTFSASAALGAGDWRFGLSAYYLSSDVKTNGSLFQASDLPIQGTSDALLLQLWAGHPFAGGTAILNAAWSEAADQARTTSHLQAIEAEDIDSRILSIGAAWRTPEAHIGVLDAALTVRAQHLRFEPLSYDVKADGEAFLRVDTEANRTTVLAMDIDARADWYMRAAQSNPIFAAYLPKRASWRGALGVSFLAGGRERDLSVRVAGYNGVATPQVQLVTDSLDRLLMRASTSLQLDFDESSIAIEGFGARSDDAYRAYGAGVRCEWRFGG